MGSLPSEQRFKVNSICIIGAGPSGLAAAKYLLAERVFSRVAVFEQRATVGGIWNYVPCPDDAPKDLSIPQTNPHAGRDKPTWRRGNAAKRMDQCELDEPSFVTPLYDRLETNIPRDLMGFSDLEWPDDCQLFPEHEKVLQYLERYSKDVRHLIQFQKQVLNVRLTTGDRWTVKVQSLSEDGNSGIEEEVFDAVVVASGHFNVPYVPAVAGIEAWSKAYPGAISHSKFYRNPKHYAGRKVIVVGNSASGIDIGSQIQESCKWPLIVSQKSESFLLSAQTTCKVEKPPIAEYILQDRTVRFEDGSEESDIDAVLYCTGYFYDFPFLDHLDPPVVTNGERVENTYQHIFYQPHPTLAFPVLNQKIIPFPLAEAQCAVIARLWSGRLSLPPQDKMQAWEQQTIAEMGNGRYFHVLRFPKDADYIDMCHDWAMSADREVRVTKSYLNGAVQTREVPLGKEPPYWTRKEYWARERFPAIKKAFSDFGEARHSKRTLEDVGFSYEDWKKQKAEESIRLL